MWSLQFLIALSHCIFLPCVLNSEWRATHFFWPPCLERNNRIHLMSINQTGISYMWCCFFFLEDLCDFPGQSPILKSDLDTFKPSYWELVRPCRVEQCTNPLKVKKPVSLIKMSGSYKATVMFRGVAMAGGRVQGQSSGTWPKSESL